MRAIPRPCRGAGRLPDGPQPERRGEHRGRARPDRFRRKAVRARGSHRTGAKAGRGAASAVIEDRLRELDPHGAPGRGSGARDRRRSSRARGAHPRSRRSTATSRRTSRLHWRRATGRSPRDVADAVSSRVPETHRSSSAWKSAGPGFLNFFVTNDWLLDALREVVVRGTDYGRAEPSGKRVQVEFVSSNPTGPLTIGHARNAAVGDALASLLEHAGGEWNASITSTMPAVRWIVSARRWRPVTSRSWVSTFPSPRTATTAPTWWTSPGHPPDRGAEARRSSARRTARSIPRSGGRAGHGLDRVDAPTLRGAVRHLPVRADLAEAGEIDEAITRLRDAGYVYDAEGAVWFRSTAFGDDKDRVVVRSNGVHTYFGRIAPT